ncbi:helix-turn-helix domain-containing protein [Streptomyces sp. NPDC002588]|uniref:TetR/AcrR family transcriptional regulator n=1 Tax=Streptomyces sp. NPDC002588 TaxID=3154419 RepID=UPI00331979E7
MVAAPSRTATHTVTGQEGTRDRILGAALRLFAEHSFAGTSLQMIADETGLTKAAVYHHFHTREDLLTALGEPALTEMRAAIEAATAQRTPSARAERMLTEFVDLALRHRKLTSMLATDQAMIHLFRTQGHYDELVGRPLTLLAGSAPDPAGRISAAVALAGIAITAGRELTDDLEDDTARRHLVETGRRILGLRAPRTPR